MAHTISSQRGCHVTWETPLGLPVKQPYSTEPSTSAHMDTPLFQRNWQIHYNPDPIKQKNAFPPNFIHSLDSVHMMLTALHCSRAGLTFASVHDCFWTHASTVDTMNKICREEFVALYRQPILENLSDYMMTKFAYTDKEIVEFKNENLKQKAIQFNALLKAVPTRGDFNLEEILKSTYFFS